MTDDEKDIELIEAYLKGELSDAAVQEFEFRRKTDASFDSGVNDYLSIMKEIRTAGQQSFIGKVKEWENEVATQEKEKKVIPMRRFLSLAATVLMIVVGGVYWIVKSGPSSHSGLFDEYFKPYEDVISERSSVTGSLHTGMNYYNQGNYKEAIRHLKEASEQDPGNLSIRCYLGIAFLGAHQMKEAKDTLLPVAQSTPGLYQETAEWYLAMAYLGANDIASLKRQLNTIRKHQDHLYFSSAVSLSESL